MEQKWFEMSELRARQLGTGTWIPLRASKVIRKEGRYGYVGYLEVYEGVGTVAFPVECEEAAKALEWSDIGPSHSHSHWIRDGRYEQVDAYAGRGEALTGLHLVLSQSGYGDIPATWHLHQDFVLALNLYREDDVWVRPAEGYVEVAQLLRNAEGYPIELRVRTEHLRDYLAARGMGLQTASFFERDAILPDAARIDWPDGNQEDTLPAGSWEGRVMPIHEGGGEPFGSSTSVMHVWNEEVDRDEDVPKFNLPASGGNSRSWSVEATGNKLYRVIGELWRNEWIRPADFSPRVRGDSVPPIAFFITDGSGKTESRHTLGSQGQWLWFKPEVVNALLHHRDGRLRWYTRDTGSVGIDEGSTVHFGLNDAGLLNVFAKDIGQLDDWQQKVWAAYNVTPDGRVSAELWKAQMDATPADSLAPEAFVQAGLDAVNDAAQKRYGTKVFRAHAEIGSIMLRCHRFRATETNGILSLAKDLARLSADSIDTQALQSVLQNDKQGLKSLKAVQALVALSVSEEKARMVMAPLFGIYDLRLADAHLPASDLSSAFSRASVNTGSPRVVQGFELLHTFVGTLYGISYLVAGVQG